MGVPRREVGGQGGKMQKCPKSFSWLLGIKANTDTPDPDVLIALWIKMIYKLVYQPDAFEHLTLLFSGQQI